MAVFTVSTVTESEIADDGSFAISYPDGTSSLSFADDGDHYIVIDSQDKWSSGDPGVDFEFGVATIKITNKTGDSIKKASSIVVNLVSKSDTEKKLDQHDFQIGGRVSITEKGAISGTSPATAQDSTSAIQAALDTDAAAIYIPEGYFRVVDSNLDGTPVLTSAVANRRIFGPGIITATSQVYRLLDITGDDTEVSINVDGNNNIGSVLRFTGALNPHAHNCRIYDLNGFANWEAVAIRAVLDGLDTEVRFHDNHIYNLTATGDGTPGNGVGLVRGIIVSHDAAQTNPIHIYDNEITDVEGEEGDSIAVIAFNGVSTFYDLPTFIQGNDVHGWTRRAVKVQAGSATVDGNNFSQNLSADPGSLQRVVDFIQGGDQSCTNNRFKDCLYQQQIGAFFDASEASDNFTVAGNIIEGLGAETSFEPILIQNHGTGVQVLANTINCPNLTQDAIRVQESTDPLIGGNITRTGQQTWLGTFNSTGVRLGVNTHNGGAGMEYGTWWDVDTGHLYVDLSTGSRKLVLMQRDTTLSDGEVIAQIACQQNDASYPDGIHSSIRFVAEGTTGATGIEFLTGGGGDPESSGVRITSGGIVEPIEHDIGQIGTPAATFDRAYLNHLRLADAISTPATQTGQAAIYVDSTDGDLKVKFGDGTVKTIATDA